MEVQRCHCPAINHHQASVLGCRSCRHLHAKDLLLPILLVVRGLGQELCICVAMGVSRTVLPITTVAAWPGWNFGGMKSDWFLNWETIDFEIARVSQNCRVHIAMRDLKNDSFARTVQTGHEHPSMSKQVQNSNLQIQKPSTTYLIILYPVHHLFSTT